MTIWMMGARETWLPLTEMALLKKIIVMHLLDDKHDKLANTVSRHEATVSMVYKVKLLLGLLFSQVTVRQWFEMGGVTEGMSTQ